MSGNVGLGKKEVGVVVGLQDCALLAAWHTGEQKKKVLKTSFKLLETARSVSDCPIMTAPFRTPFREKGTATI